MEIVLLWLDDLDDLLFSLALSWERARRAILEVGLAAAFALAASDRLAVAGEYAPLFVNIAAASVAAWVLGGVFRLFYYRTRLAAA